jgi:putative addiction module killer protein
MDELRDRQAKQRIDEAIFSLSQGKYGLVKPLRKRISEIRIDHGPGYGIYLTRRGEQIIILLVGGDKRTQGRDIEQAIWMAKEV